MEGNEKAYSSMGVAGVVNIVLGIVFITVGAVAGAFIIATGAKLLKDKKLVTF